MMRKMKLNYDKCTSCHLKSWEQIFDLEKWGVCFLSVKMSSVNMWSFEQVLHNVVIIINDDKEGNFVNIA